MSGFGLRNRIGGWRGLLFRRPAEGVGAVFLICRNEANFGRKCMRGFRFGFVADEFAIGLKLVETIEIAVELAVRGIDTALQCVALLVH